MHISTTSARREVVAQRRVADRRVLDEQPAFHELLARVRGPVLGRRQRHLVGADLREQPLERRLRGFDRVSRLEPREHLDPARAPIVHVQPAPLGRHHRLHQDRHANLRRRAPDRGQRTPARHADDRHRVVVDEDLLADDVGIAGEAAHPVVVAQDDDRMALVDLVVFLRIEDASGAGFTPSIEK